MLIRRADALATMWDGSFAEEAAKLVLVSPRDRELFAREPASLVAMPREQTLYTDAARQFHAGDLASAARGFEALLRLPARERQRLSVAAAYSLGRARSARYEDARAIAAFRQVRELVRAGFVDDQHLATSSLGEEAFVVARESLPRAIRLYAEQAALGDPGGVTSLLQVARGASWRDRELARDDVAVALLALYYYTRGHELSDGDRAVWGHALARQVTSARRGAAFMAAASYRDGAWDAAKRFAGMSRAPIATWVRAKLALREGDRAGAERLLREVERAHLVGNVDSEIASYDLDADPSSLVRGELGVLALASDRFTEAAEWFARGNRQVEAAYVAERAMTFDELRAAVQHAPPMGAPPMCDDWAPTSDADRARCWAHHLVDIYARRLLRADRYAEALEAWGDDRPRTERDVDDDDATENDPDPAAAFVKEMKRAAATTGIERAEHLFAASRTLRSYGMEIAGTEVGPDWKIYDGGYQGDTLCLPSPTHGYTAFAVRDGDGYYTDDDGDGCLRPTKEDAALVSPLEADRVRASAPTIDQRFSYRYAASRLAEEAAGLVPPRSQAYATLLCWAARYASRDPARVDELYEMYVRNGAAGYSIGASCEEPDFGRARTFDDDQAQRRAAKLAAAQRAREWTWPRVRDAAWRRRGWLWYPLAALALIVLARLVLARAAYAPGFARDKTDT